MKAILLTFDSLNRHWLGPYGGSFVDLPQFERLATLTTKFTNAYVGSMPCMPARRELHTGRHNFTHTNWGGLEPYDFSVFAALHEAGIRTHHCTDHYHYWEDGGSHYMQRYSAHETFRGQEGDLWISGPNVPPCKPLPSWKPLSPKQEQDQRNRAQMQREVDWPMHQTVSAGLRFLERNAGKDDWLLHVETFDPHEPFFAPPRFRERVAEAIDQADHFCDWPPYGRMQARGVTPEQLRAMRAEYTALLMFCDEQLGRVLDAMDRHNLWEDTMLIVHTDHGFLLGEHEMTGKGVTPLYNEVARIPYFVWDPRSGIKGEARESLVQNIDLAPTFLSYFGQPIPQTMTGHDLQATIANDQPVRETAIMGFHSGFFNVVRDDGTCGSFYPDESVPLYIHTLDHTQMRGFYALNAFRERETDRAYDFTQGCVLDRFPSGDWKPTEGGPYETVLFNLKEDPGQNHPLDDPQLHQQLLEAAVPILQRHDTPHNFYERYHLPSSP